MTTYDQYAYDDSMAQQPTPNQPEQEDNLPGKALNASQKKAIAAALVGTAALGGAAYGLSRLEDSDGSDQLADNGNGGATDTAPAHPVATPVSFVSHEPDIAVISDEPRLATSVTDDMTFDEAFAAARGEMGPGDYFEWHGNYYNTFFKDEWDGLSETEHQAFKASLGDLVDQSSAEPVLAHTEPAEPAHHHASAHTAHVAHVAHHDAAPAPHETEVASHATVSVIDDIAGADSNVTVMHVDGHDVSLIDTNNDQKTDMTLADNNVVLVDTDRDHLLDSQGDYNASTHKVEHMHALESPIGAPDMDAEDRHLPADYEPLYSSHDLGHDHLAQSDHSDSINLGN